MPHARKFCDPATGDLIAQSAKYVQDFSALKAAQAFQDLEKYAANLINKPWRHEFREIKVKRTFHNGLKQILIIFLEQTYGGFYKHNIECALSGAERIFYQMGYVSSGNSHSLVMEGGDGGVDQDKAITVARDCRLAYTECQVRPLR